MRPCVLFIGFASLMGLIHSSISASVHPGRLDVMDTVTAPRPVALKGKASVGPPAPLDINDNVGHTLELVSTLVGTLGGSASGLVMGLTGISITDCAGSLKGQDLNQLSCEDFLDTISECDSLKNLKDLLQQAKKNYRKKPNKRAPCFKNKKKSG